MDQRDLGKTGLKVSVLGFGSGAGGDLMTRGAAADQAHAVARAMEAGITHFDTAPGYGQGRSEENLGRVLGELKAWDKVVLGTTKQAGVSGHPHEGCRVQYLIEVVILEFLA